MYVCVCDHHLWLLSMDQPGEVANLARGQLLNRNHGFFPVPVRAWEFGLARRVRPSRPASACSFSKLGLDLVLTREIPTAFRHGVHLFIPSTAIGSVPSSSGHHAILRTDGVHCRESASAGPVVLKVVPVTSASFPGTWSNFCAPLFSHTKYWYSRHARYRTYRRRLLWYIPLRTSEVLNSFLK